jgi:hypothetical protein
MHSCTCAFEYFKPAVAVGEPYNLAVACKSALDDYVAVSLIDFDHARLGAQSAAEIETCTRR